MSEKKKRSSSSKRWLKEHFDDVYVAEAKKKGLRSRAAFKLDEILQKDALIKPGMCVVDLGAAPGGWSQQLAELVKPEGLVIACDILPMDPIPGVLFLQGDFTQEAVLNALLGQVGKRGVDIVLSDMSPNLSGNESIDQPKCMYLVELALDMCHHVLTKNGSMVVKVFQGEGFDSYLQTVRKSFKSVKIRKPKSSRARSREVYVVAIGYTQ